MGICKTRELHHVKGGAQSRAISNFYVGHSTGRQYVHKEHLGHSTAPLHATLIVDTACYRDCFFSIWNSSSECCDLAFVVAVLFTNTIRFRRERAQSRVSSM